MTSLHKIGFVGLGIMGGPMAANLVKAGFEVTGYDRSRQAVDRLVAQGGIAAHNIAEAVRGADVVITMLPDSPDVEAVWLDEGGVVKHAARGRARRHEHDPAGRSSHRGRARRRGRAVRTRRTGVGWRGWRHRRHALSDGRR